MFVENVPIYINEFYIILCFSLVHDNNNNSNNNNNNNITGKSGLIVTNVRITKITMPVPGMVQHEPELLL
jgi:hypothetical protein